MAEYNGRRGYSIKLAYEDLIYLFNKQIGEDVINSPIANIDVDHERGYIRVYINDPDIQIGAYQELPQLYITENFKKDLNNIKETL